LRLVLLSANLDVEGGADRGKGRRHVGQGDVLAERWGWGTARYHTDLLAGFVAAAVLVASYAAIDHLQADESPRQTGRFCFLERRAADEVAFIHFGIAIETGFPDVDLVADFVAVQGHLRFEAQSVARTEAASNDAELLAGFEDFVPDHF